MFHWSLRNPETVLCPVPSSSDQVLPWRSLLPQLAWIKHHQNLQNGVSECVRGTMLWNTKVTVTSTALWRVGTEWSSSYTQHHLGISLGEKHKDRGEIRASWHPFKECREPSRAPIAWVSPGIVASMVQKQCLVAGGKMVSQQEVDSRSEREEEKAINGNAMAL